MAEEQVYLIVNPAGAMHVVSKDHARARLRIAGWRLATKEEQAAYNAAGGNQTSDKPLATPFNPEPQVEDALTDAFVDSQMAEAEKKAEPKPKEKKPKAK